MAENEVFLTLRNASTAMSMPVFKGGNVEVVTSVQRRTR